MKIKINTATKNSHQKLENTTWLQGIGNAHGKQAVELTAGDVMVWNYGAISKVAGIVKRTEKFITILEEYKDSFGSVKRSERRMKKDRIVALAK